MHTTPTPSRNHDVANIEDELAIALGERDALLECVLLVRAHTRRGHIDPDEAAERLRRLERALGTTERRLDALRKARGDVK